MESKTLIKIEVAYALPTEQAIVPLEVEQGTTIEQAIGLSDLLTIYPEIDVGKTNKVGIFGKLSKGGTVLREGDRVEIYRPLIADPKEVRRRRAAEGKRMRKGGGEMSADEKAAPVTEESDALAGDKE